MNTHRDFARRRLLTVLGCLIACLIAGMGPLGTSAARLTASSVWPKFSTASAVFDVDATSLSSADRLTASTLQGTYNGEQHPTRLYLDQTANDPFWLANGMPPRDAGGPRPGTVRRERPGHAAQTVPA